MRHLCGFLSARVFLVGVVFFAFFRFDCVLFRFGWFSLRLRLHSSR